MKSKYNISIIGAGKVGTAVGHLLLKKGHNITAAAACSNSSLEKASRFLPGVTLTKDSAKAVCGADVILITTRDEQIKPACDKLEAAGVLLPEHIVMHMSGAGSLDLLSSAKAAGAKVASLHPIQSFASIELAIERLPGSYFGLTAEGPARDAALRIAQDLDGKVIEIADENKSLYHAAACIASNYLVALLGFAEEVYKASGLDKDIALKAMMPLVKGTLSNIENVGIAAALTGPIARGDVKIIKQHLESLDKINAKAASAYRVLGLKTVEIAIEKGTLGQENAVRISAILKDGL
ncbi:MAG: DUF2520 domain-containing protein [Actinomycetota bacterium]|nr:DUF2520 domain-containing protein [Actinomycetota bacterium]